MKNLEIKILALNELSKAAKKEVSEYLYHYDKFVGLDIFKVDGSVAKKYKKESTHVNKKLSDGSNLSISAWSKKFSNHFGVRVKICVNGGSYEETPSTAFCQYEDKFYSLYDLKNNELAKPEIGVFNRHSFPIFKAEKLLRMSNKAKKAAEKYRGLAKDIPYEFMDVLNVERLTR